ncbi:MAG TPA: glycoside hydrolase family 3 N-terminal domain-containing protein [Mucilaginibacter sp.]|jgi:beta-glucosidase
MIKKSRSFFLQLLIVACTIGSAKGQQNIPPFRNPALSIDARVDNLVGSLTLEEKISLLGYQSKAVPRLGIPAYNWWNEALHGVARAGEATVFPQAIGMAATFNDDLLKQVATCISTEARAKYNMAIAKDEHLQYRGLTFWSPNINIFRDPRWGRGQETYGEDPYLTGRMGSAFVTGMQGTDPNHLKTAACAKHFAVHSGPEAGRGSFNAIIDQKDLRETYLPAFHQLVDAGVESVMGAYNRVNGEPCTISKTLIGILRGEWGFKGHLLTDCGALDDIWANHKVLPNRVEVAAAAIKAGVNLDCSTLLQRDLMDAVKQNLVTEKEIDASLKTLLKTQFKLGFYDNPSSSPYANYGVDSVRSANHILLARKMAEQGMVLLKNNNNLLPINLNKTQSIFVTGPNSFNADVLLGNYRGISPQMVTFTEGITKAAGPGITVQYEMGSDLLDSARVNGMYTAASSDVTFAVIGLSPLFEGEEGDAFLSKNGADKMDLRLPAVHIAFLKKLRKASKKPIVAVITSGSDVDIAEIEPYADAIILTWYPGEQGGNALADIVFGKVSPSGHLPVTFYKSLNDLPDYKDYNMKGRTYRYFTGDVQYPFGYGLSYTTFNYSWKTQPVSNYKDGQKLTCTLAVDNTGQMDGDEVVQAYVKYPDGERMPLKELKQFKRVSVAKGSQQQVAIDIPLADLKKWDLKDQKWKLYKGKYTLVLGSNSADQKLAASFNVK